MAKNNFGDMWNKAKQAAKESAFSEAVPVELGKHNMQLVGWSIGDFGGKRQVMAKFCVVGDNDDKGKICTTWSSLEEDRIVWLIRMLAAMGVDVEGSEVNDEDDIQTIGDNLIEANTVCLCKVVDKDGYRNLYVNGVTDVDSDDLVDPEEVLKSSKKSKGKDDKSKDKPEPKKEDDDDDGVEIDVGDRVKWVDKATKKEVEGVIKSFDGDDKAVVVQDGTKTKVTIALEKLEPADAAPAADDDDDKPKTDEFEPGDIVIFKHDGKKRSGAIAKVKGETLYVKVKGEDEPVKVAKSDAKFATDD